MRGVEVTVMKVWDPMTARYSTESYAFPPLYPRENLSPPATTTTTATTTSTSGSYSTHDTIYSHPSSAYHNPSLDTVSFSSTATPSSSSFSHSFSASPPLSHLDEVPKLGSIRCYWTILSPSLDYVYLDPILETHLGEFAQQFVGSNLLDFVHPDERDQLAEDLLPRPDRIAGVETAGVFGSVTRLRYSRLVGILRKLGCLEVPTLPDADKYALDADYLNLDLTTSWIAGNGIARGQHGDAGSTNQLGQGAVLAFFHVIGDKDHVKNNDLYDRGDWTNWCGVQVDEHRYFTPHRCQALVDVLERITSPPSRPSTGCKSEEDSKSALIASLHGLSSETIDGPPPHVFQILDRNGKAIVSFPNSEDQDGRKRYEVESYAALAREVVARPRGAANAKTSCTKRYRSKHPVMKDSILTTIESVVIMYGSVTFACFQTGGIYLTSARKAALGLNQPSMSPTPGSTANDFNLEDVPSTAPNPKSFLGYHKRSTPHDRGSPALGSPPVKRIKAESTLCRPRLSIPPANSELPYQTGARPNMMSAASRGSYRPSLEPEHGQNGGISPTVASASAILGSISSNYADVTQPSDARGHHPTTDYPSYPSSTFPYIHPPSGAPSSSSTSLYPTSRPSHSISKSPRQVSQDHQGANGYFPPSFDQTSTRSQPPATSTSSDSSSTFAGDVRPVQPLRSPARERPHPLATVDSNGAAADSNEDAAATTATTTDPAQAKKSRGRPFKPCVKACESCGSAESPEWRKGPSGAKSLCNACGLRYARTVARQKKLNNDQSSEPPAPKKKKSKKAPKAKEEQGTSVATASTPSLPATSSGHTTYEPPVSRSDVVPIHKAYTPYYTAGPPHNSSYALVAAHPPPSSSDPPTNPAISAYPVSTSGYYPATTTYPYSTYPPTSTPILTHIPIHHTLAATLAPLSAPVSVHSHEYSHNGPVSTSVPHSSSSFSSSSAADAFHALSQAPESGGLYHNHMSGGGGGGQEWQPSHTSSELLDPTSSAPNASSVSASLAPDYPSINSHSTSPHLHHPRPSPSYQSYQAWDPEHANDLLRGGGAE